MIALALAALLAGGAALALAIGRAIRIADEAELPVRPIPARLDPRAGQNADRAARSTFTTLLVLAVVVGAGAAQDVFSAVGGVQ